MNPLRSFGTVILFIGLVGSAFRAKPIKVLIIPGRSDMEGSARVGTFAEAILEMH